MDIKILINGNPASKIVGPGWTATYGTLCIINTGNKVKEIA